RLGLNTAFASSSVTTSSRHMPWTVDGSRDSPIWYRGNVSFSRSSTRCPCAASRVDTVEPPGPPQTTIRSIPLIRDPPRAGARRGPVGSSSVVSLPRHLVGHPVQSVDQLVGRTPEAQPDVLRRAEAR